MPSFEVIGRDYARQVHDAVRADAHQHKVYVTNAYAGIAVPPWLLAGTNLVATLKEIARAVENDWNIEGRPLTREQKDEILRQTGRALGLPRPDDFGYVTNGASNDAYMQLVTYISQLLPTQSKK